jgi:hypothetical protein
LICTSYFKADKKALVDLGATDNFMHPVFAAKNGIGVTQTPNTKKININNTTNKSGKITHYFDLDICTNRIHREMRFLILDIGNEDMLLGYPWLATFEPKFNWQHATINEHILPVIISSINPRVICNRPIIATTLTEAEKHSIVQTLEAQSTIWGVSTKLAIQAGQNTKAAVVLMAYDQFHKLFSDEEPSCSHTLNCRTTPLTSKKGCPTCQNARSFP